MILARVIRDDEDSLICDLAETYHILDYKRLPVPLVAALVVGLGPNSRVARSKSPVRVDADILLLATIADYLALLVWMNSKDGSKNRNRPKSIYQAITIKSQPISGFKSGEDYEKARKEILERIERV